MAIKCNRCGGIGYIEKFSGIEHGECFKCCGTGSVLTSAERAKIALERADKHDAKMAKEQGVSLYVFQAYVAPARFGLSVPKHANGCSYSIKEFEAWLSAA
jgi:hypothetical protein